MKIKTLGLIMIMGMQAASAGDLSDALTKYYGVHDEVGPLEDNNTDYKTQISSLNDKIEGINASIERVNAKIYNLTEEVVNVEDDINLIDEDIKELNNKVDKLEKQTNDPLSVLGGIPWFLVGMWIAIIILLILRRD